MDGNTASRRETGTKERREIDRQKYGRQISGLRAVQTDKVKRQMEIETLIPHRQTDILIDRWVEEVVQGHYMHALD